MFGFFKRNAKNKRLEAIIQSIQMNLSNNYKDAAQMDLKEFGEVLEELSREGKLTEGQKHFYEVQLGEFQEKMKNFTHKDQKAGW